MPELDLSTITFNNSANTVTNTNTVTPAEAPTGAAALRNSGAVNTLGGADVIRGTLQATSGLHAAENFYGIDLEFGLGTSSGNDTVAGLASVVVANGSFAVGIDMARHGGGERVQLNTGTGDDTVTGTGQVNGSGYAWGIRGDNPNEPFNSQVITGAGVDKVNLTGVAQGPSSLPAARLYAFGAQDVLIDTDAHGVACKSDADKVSAVAVASGSLADAGAGNATGLANAKVLTGASADIVTANAGTAVIGSNITGDATGMYATQVLTGSGSDRVMAVGAAATSGESANAASNATGGNTVRASANTQGGGSEHAHSYGILEGVVDTGTGNDIVVGVAVAAAEGLAVASGIKDATIRTGDGFDKIFGVASAAAGNVGSSATALVRIGINDTNVTAQTGGANGNARAIGLDNVSIDTGNGNDVVVGHAFAAGGPVNTDFVDILDSDIRLGSGNDLVRGFRVDGTDVFGGAGNDWLEIGSGVGTTIDGGSNGTAGDVLVLAGNSDDYDIGYIGGTSLEITDRNANVQDTDLHVSNIEWFQFADSLVSFDDFLT